MWNKILILALLVFSGSVYIFISNHKAQSKAQGEVAALQQLFEDIAAKSSDIALDERIKVYAEMRAEYFEKETAKFDAQKEDFDTKTSDMQMLVEEANASTEKADTDHKALEDALNNIMKEAATALGVEGSNFQISDISSSVVALDDNIKAAELKISEEDASIAAGEVEDMRLQTIIGKIEELTSDRQARLSPAQLNCSVLSADSNWNYVVLDAGADKGVVIGSNVAVMRGDVKIAELLITLVEKNRSSGDIIHKSVSPGEVVKLGDKIISVRKK